MDSELGELETAVRELRESLRQIDSRLLRQEEKLARLARSPAAVEESAPSPEVIAPSQGETAQHPGPQAQLALVGRSLIVLGGAYLLRAITDLGVVPGAIGAAAALLYAASFLWLADRAAARGANTSSAFHAGTTLFVAYPLVYEMVLRLKLIAPWTGALLVALFGCTAGLVAVRRRLPAAARVISLSTALVVAALAAQTPEGAPYLWLSALLSLLGIAAARRLGSRFLAWPILLTGDVLAMVAAESALSGTPLNVSARLGIYAFFAASTFGAMWVAETSWVEVLQVVVGFGVVWIEGARMILHSGERLGFGGLALGLALAGWLAARRTRATAFWTSFWLAAGLVALIALADGAALALLALALALALIVSARRSSGPWTVVHAVAALVVAAAASGLLGFSLEALAGVPEELAAPRPFALLVLAVLLALVVGFADPPSSSTDQERAARVALAALAFLGAAGLTAWGGIVALHATGGLAATVRTGVLASGAVALALASRLRRMTMLGHLVYPVLVALGVKLVLEDLRVGVAASLFADFALLGLALIVAPRLRAQARKE